MPKKKNPPAEEPISESTPEPVETVSLEPIPEPSSIETETSVATESPAEIEAIREPESNTGSQKKPISQRVVLAGAVAAGILLGFFLSYVFLVKPAQDLLSVASDLQSNGVISSNQIKSDLSNTRLRQQEMEIRYLTAAARLESANQYIFLLRMKEQVAVAHLSVERNEGLEARKSLAEIKTLFDHLRPYIAQKDAAAADELDTLILTAIQDLTSDPESASSDLDTIASHLNKVEAALFQME